MKKLMAMAVCVAMAFLAFGVQPCAAGDENPVFKSVRSAWLSITSADTANRFKIDGTAVTASATELNTAVTVTSDADITDLADGSLTGSKVGTGIAAGNVTTGNAPLSILTNALATASGVLITNTSISATGATNTVIYVPLGAGIYVVKGVPTTTP